MLLRKYSHPKYLQVFKNILAILAFVYPAYEVLTSISRIDPNNILVGITIEIILSFVMLTSLLVTAYFFQDIWVDEDGLQIEFLWKKIRVRWVDIIEAKSARGFWLASGKNQPWVVLVNGLTPFHRIFGLLYGLSTKPGFVLFSSISGFQELKPIIQSNTTK